MQETWVQILSLEDPLEEEIATSPVFLPGKTPWTKKKKTLQVTLLVKLEFLFFYLAIYMKSRIQLTNYRFHIKDSTPDHYISSVQSLSRV